MRFDRETLTSLATQFLYLPALIVTVSVTGCAHMVELRTIEQFNSALQNNDRVGVMMATTDDFSDKALRRTEAIDDFRILNLPKGESSILNVVDVSESEKEVTVEVGSRKRKVKYRLLKHPETDKWQIDEVFLRQSQRGLTSAKSVSEQMDLLLAVREMMDVWSSGERNPILESVTTDFREILEPLPDNYLRKVIQRTMKGELPKNFRPDAQLDERIAVVRIPRSVGQLVVQFRREADRWKVSDVAAENRHDKKHVSSVKQLASIAATAYSFLAAYQADDKPGLKEITTDSFFRGSLAPADLTSVPMPTPNLRSDTYYIDMQGGHPNFIVTQAGEVVKISLKRHRNQKPGAQDRYLVEDVTIYELDGTEEKRLSAVFTGRAIMSLFAEALAIGDLQTIRHSSTQDFNDRIWRNVSRDVWSFLPLNEFQQVAPKVVSTVYNGATTEITVTQGNKAFTYVMQDQDGTLLVDDVMMPAIDRPSSLKKVLEYAMPVVLFRHAMEVDDLRLIQRTSSKDFNHMIWHQVKNIPPTTLAAKSFLATPLHSIQQDTENNIVIMFGTEYRGAKVKLVRELGFHLVDEIMLINGLEPAQRQELKHNLRIRLSKDATEKVRAAQRARQARQESAPIETPAFLNNEIDIQDAELQPRSKDVAIPPRSEVNSVVPKQPASAALKSDPFGNAEVTDSYIGDTSSNTVIEANPFTPIQIPE